MHLTPVNHLVFQQLCIYRLVKPLHASAGNLHTWRLPRQSNQHNLRQAETQRGLSGKAPVHILYTHLEYILRVSFLARRL